MPNKQTNKQNYRKLQICVSFFILFDQLFLLLLYNRVMFMLNFHSCVYLKLIQIQSNTYQCQYVFWCTLLSLSLSLSPSLSLSLFVLSNQCKIQSKRYLYGSLQQVLYSRENVMIPIASNLFLKTYLLCLTALESKYLNKMSRLVCI